MRARLLSVNVGLPREIGTRRGRPVRSSIWKAPVEGRVAVSGVNLAGDAQADQNVHGGTDKAVYAYAAEDYEWWMGELGRHVAPGTFGDNLTTEGVDVSGAAIGERWRIADAVFEVCQPRTPCYKLGLRMDDPKFPRRFSVARRPGAYLRIVEEGSVGAGDTIEVLERPVPTLSVRDVADIAHYAPERAAELLELEKLAASFREWALKRQSAQR